MMRPRSKAAFLARQHRRDAGIGRGTSGVYVIRCRKPGARLALPFLSYHFAYVGESTSVERRLAQHLQGGGRYQVTAKPWSDLSPRCVMVVKLPRWKWLLKSIETILILITWPVYNHKKNQWNPRRISLSTQHRQRIVRDRTNGRSFNVTLAHLVFLAIVLLIMWGWLT